MEILDQIFFYFVVITIAAEWAIFIGALIYYAIGYFFEKNDE